jgi:flagellar motility protein MotE (MotC chaperone)
MAKDAVLVVKQGGASGKTATTKKGKAINGQFGFGEDWEQPESAGEEKGRKKKKKKSAEQEAKEQEEREFNSNLESAISESKGKNAKAIMALLDVDKLKESRNLDKDIKAALDALRTENGYLFEDNGGTPRFTDPNGNGGNAGGGNPRPDLGKLSMADYIAARKNK